MAASRGGEVSSSDFFQQFTVTADVDLVAQSAALNPNAVPPGVACRRIKFNSSGNLQVLRNRDAAVVTLTGRVAGEIEDIQATKIVFAGSTANIVVTVYW